MKEDIDYKNLKENDFEILAMPGKKVPIISKRALENSKAPDKDFFDKCKEYAKLFKMK